MKYFIAVIGLAVLGVIAYQFDWPGPKDPAASPAAEALFTLRRDALKITVMEEGFLKAKNSTELKPEFRREGLISWLIEEGTEVKEGDVLVEFDKTDLQTQIDDLKNSLTQYETELEAAKAEQAIQERENQATVEQAELALEMAEMTLEKYEQGEAPNEKRLKEHAVEKAKSDFDRAKEKFEKVPELAKEGFFTALQVKEEEIKVQEAEITWTNAKEDLHIWLEYTHPMELKQKRADVKDKERSLANAKEKANINTKEKAAKVTSRERQVTATKVRLDKYLKEFEQMTMKAPKPGIVHYGNPAQPWYREDIKVGSRVWSGHTVITLPDLTEMQVLAEIHEADIDLVKEGQDVVITVESVPGKTFSGKVTKIASTATSQGRTEAKTFRVEISMESKDQEFRSGITAKVEIQVQ